MKHKAHILGLAGLAILVGILQAPAHAQKPKEEKLPVTYVCKHCKIKMTVKVQADWKKKCWVCPCKTTALACKPTATK